MNFAQGEMAMFTTFIAWSLITNHGFSFWPAFFATLAIAFVLGVGVERVVIRPFYRASPLTIILVTIALFVIFNGLAAWIWSPETRVFLGPFSAKPFDIGGVAIARQDVGVLVVTLMSVVLLWAFFRFTRVGLAMRAAAIGPETSRLLGVRVGWMFAAGWGFAAVARRGLRDDGRARRLPQPDDDAGDADLRVRRRGAGRDREPGRRRSSAASRSASSRRSSARYVDFISGELELPAAFVVLFLVLLVRPAGIFGRVVVRRA